MTAYLRVPEGVLSVAVGDRQSLVTDGLVAVRDEDAALMAHRDELEPVDAPAKSKQSKKSE